jgi:AraC-like DNA-binding protein
VGRILKRRLAALALMLGLIAGGAVVAMAASGSGGGSADQTVTAKAPARHGPHLLQTAAGYLGVSREALQSKLRSGQTLSQIAAAAGKSETGLQQALGQVASAKLETRVTTAQAPPARRHKHRRHNSLRDAAARYLGLSSSALRTQLRAGSTLAQIADRTPGHSAKGLIDALVAAHQKPAPSAAGSTARRLAKTRKHVAAFVNKSRSAKHAQPQTPPHA